MSFESADTSELIDRYRTLIVHYSDTAPKLASILEEFGRLKKELQLIVDEFVKRKVSIEDIDKEIASKAGKKE
ncbi:hypothetical protein HYV49_03110 [Candidatus Pacearchaeota archaeon]|nr:hypothetical protein [Candidatus Pacearchaeota archaeon]